MIDTAREPLRFLLKTLPLQAQYLQDTDGRLFAQPLTGKRAAELRADALLAERLDAFSARFARLQDTAGDKLLPALLVCLGEPVASVIDNLDRAARLRLLDESSDDWIAARALRSRMVHAYIRNPTVLAEAMTAAHAAVPMLVVFVLPCDDYARAHKLV